MKTLKSRSDWPCRTHPSQRQTSRYVRMDCTTRSIPRGRSPVGTERHSSCCISCFKWRSLKCRAILHRVLPSPSSWPHFRRLEICHEGYSRQIGSDSVIGMTISHWLIYLNSESSLYNPTTLKNVDINPNPLWTAFYHWSWFAWIYRYSGIIKASSSMDRSGACGGMLIHLQIKEFLFSSVIILS